MTGVQTCALPIYISKDAMEIDNIDGYDMYDDNLWKENRNGTQKVLNHIFPYFLISFINFFTEYLLYFYIKQK